MQALLLGWIAWVKAPVMDELAHLASGLHHLQMGKFELYRVNPPLVRCVAAVPVLFTSAEIANVKQPYDRSPLARPEFQLGMEFVTANRGKCFFYFTLARWACIPLILLGGYFCYRWACELYGNAAGYFALILWCSSPEVLAWGATITPDAASASLGVVAGYTFWRWLRRPTWLGTLAAGGALGLALLTKSTWIVLLPLWPLLWIVRRLMWHSNSPAASRWRSDSLQLGILLAAAVYVLNLGYGFEGTGQKLADYTFVSNLLNGHSTPRSVGNRFADSLWGQVIVPLPENYVRGLDVQRGDFERGKWSYLRGEWKRGGWWYYYLYAYAIKTPLGVLGLITLATLATALSPRFRFGWQDAVVLAMALAIVGLVSSQTGFNRYFRYVLPAWPFLLIWASKTGLFFSTTSRTLQMATSGLLLWAIGSSLYFIPHSMAYFNEIASGPAGGHKHLVDANIDWGQDLLELKRWYHRHPEARPLHLKYFGWVSPEHAGLNTLPVPRLLGDHSRWRAVDENGPGPGWYAVSVNYLCGYRDRDGDHPYYTYFQELTPVARIGYSIYVYRLRAEDTERLRVGYGDERP